jgi:hypothetical protein
LRNDPEKIYFPFAGKPGTGCDPSLDAGCSARGADRQTEYRLSYGCFPIFVRPFGSGIKIRGYDEVFNVIIMPVVAIVFSAVMLGPWEAVKDAANFIESGDIHHFLFCKTSNRLAGKPAPDKTLIFMLTGMLIPVGIFAWIAFSLPGIMVNYGHVISILSDPPELGWDIFNFAGIYFKPFIPDKIPFIQGWLLLAGLYMGLKRAQQAVSEVIENRRETLAVMALPALYALVFVNILLKIFM